MISLLEIFHVNLELLVAQVINFLIVMSVLWFLAVKPLIKIMNERTEKIEKSLDHAKEIEEKLEQTNVEREKILTETKKETAVMLEKAMSDVESNKKDILVKTKIEVEKVVTQGKEQLAEEKKKMIENLKGEIYKVQLENY